MIKIVPVAGICCVLAAAGFGIRAEPGDYTDVSAEIAGLKKQISSLEERIKSLEKRLENSTIIRFDIPPHLDKPIIKTPEMFLRHKHLPKGWIQREFNGIPYYIIPLSQDVK